MRVLFLNPVGQLGGGERSLIDLLSALRSFLPEIELHVVVGLDGPLIAECTALGATVHPLFMPTAMAGLGDSGLSAKQGRSFKLVGLARSGPVFFSTWSYLKKLKALIRQINPDIIHSNGMKFHLLSAVAAPSQVPLIWHVRDFVSSRRIIKHALKLCLKFRRSLGVIAISKAIHEDVRAVLGNIPIWTVYNAINTQHFADTSAWKKTDLEELAGLATAPLGTLRVGLVATYARWKGQDLFLEAAAKVVRTLPDALVRFYIIGGPIYATPGSQFSKEELRNLANDLDISQNVGFVPLQPDVAPIYQALDIVVQSSTKPEPFGRTIVEAMASSRSVIVSNAGGASELFTSGLDAIGFLPGNVTSLADSICMLLTDSQLRSDLSQAARTTAESRFSRNRLGIEVGNIYRAFLS